MHLNIDTEAIEIERQLTKFDEDGLFRVAHNVLDGILREKCSRPSNASDPSEVETYLNSCRHVIEQELIEKAQLFSPARWTWYIRRLPAKKMDHVTSDPYDKALLQCIACMSDAPESDSKSEIKENRLVFPVDITSLTELFKLYAGALFLSDIHTGLRYVGKRVTMDFGEHSLPIASPNDDEKEAIRLYDERLTLGSISPLNRTGTILNMSEVEQIKDVAQILTACRRQTTVVETGYFDKATGDPLKTVANFWAEFTDLDDLSRFAKSFKDELWWNDEAGHLILLLRCAAMALALQPPRWIPLVFAGYLFIPARDLLEIIEPTFHQASAFVKATLPGYNAPKNLEELFQTMSKWKPFAWPIVAPKPLHQIQNAFLIDIYAATNRLNSALEFPRTLSGTAGQIRGMHFEGPTQQIIDDSPWAPAPNLKSFRGRQLNLKGKAITDIDAIGILDKTLLCVSCKSIVYDGSYDAGDFRVVMGAARQLEDKRAEWSAISKILKENPVGDNYDFSSFDEMIFVVCTPNPMYIPIGPCSEFVAKGLRAVVSFTELDNWLHE